jgi:hypothetical protein
MFQVQIAERIASLDNGRAIELLGDQQLGEFLDALDREVDLELIQIAHEAVLPTIGTAPPTD